MAIDRIAHLASMVIFRPKTGILVSIALFLIVVIFFEVTALAHSVVATIANPALYAAARDS